MSNVEMRQLKKQAYYFKVDYFSAKCNRHLVHRAFIVVQLLRATSEDACLREDISISVLFSGTKIILSRAFTISSSKLCTPF